MCRNGKQSLLSQVIEFHAFGDPYGCKYRFNAVTITWQNGYKPARCQRLAALAFELRKANLQVRMVKADMIERNILSNKMSHLSAFGCDQCVCKTVGGHYPVDETFDEPLRDEATWEREITPGHTFLGRKGPAPLKDLPGFSITQGFVVDPMHQIFIGHVHTLIRRFLLSDECHEGKNVQAAIMEQMNSNYCGLVLPLEVQRKTRPYDKAWCANELKVWLLACGHKMADILEEAGLHDIAVIFGRFTFFVRALLLPEEWLIDAEKERDLQTLIKDHLTDVERLLGPEAMSANSHALSHLRFWRQMYSLSEMSCSPGEAFFGENKRSMDVRNRHYGRQMHLNRMTQYLRGHTCTHTFFVKKSTRRDERDNSIFVDTKMRVYK